MKNTTRRNINKRCYVVYGNGVNPMRIKGANERDALMKRIKAKGFYPKYSRVSGQCSRKATLYNRIKGAITIR